jgi:hypothetical protein
VLIKLNERNIHLGLFSQFQELSLVGVSFVPVPNVFPSLPLLRSCVVSSRLHHHLLIPIATFINLLLIVSIDSNSYRGIDDGCNLGKPKRVERLADT